MASYYLFIKSLHIIAVISWMAGMLYLPRLFVYHTSANPGGELDKTLKIMERRLMRIIINPAMIVSFLLGLWLIYITKAGAPGTGYWLHAKGLLLFFMFGCHGMMSRYRKAFERGENKKSAKFFRILNEVPSLLMIGIVILAVMKPF